MGIPERKTRVFVSYSRSDQEFVTRLVDSLETVGYLADWDQSRSDPVNVTTGIAAEDEWWTRLQEMISIADVVVFVISPVSAASPVCDEEIAFARAVGKRVIAVLWRPIDFTTAPPRLAALNVKLSFDTDTCDYESSLHALVAAIDVDVHWMRDSTRLTEMALRWDAAGRDADVLLQGSELLAAETLAARRPQSAPPIVDVVLAYLAASRAGDEARRKLFDAERARFLEIERVTREFLQAELELRESLPPSTHWGVADEERTEIELIRSLVEVQTRWHPQPAKHVQSTGANEGYAEIFLFPCCQRYVKDFLATSDSDPTSQFRADGCEEIPDALRHESPRRLNPFRSALVARYRSLSRSS